MQSKKEVEKREQAEGPVEEPEQQAEDHQKQSE
jgi:hypothetical protein